MPKVTDYNVHATDVQRFRQCRQLWQWASPLRSNLTPKETYAPFFVGSLVHYGLEHLYRNGTNPAQALAEYAITELGALPAEDSPLYEHYELAVALVEHYRLWQSNDRSQLADSQLEHIATEQEFQYLLWRNSRKRVYVRGRYDGIVRHKATGLYYLHEVKTTRSIRERIRQTDLDTQTDTYLLTSNRVLSELLGTTTHVEGVIYTLLRKKIPATPAVLKSGNLSVAKISTTPYAYAAAIRAHHGTQLSKSELAALYGDYLQALIAADGEDPFFTRIIVKRTPEELASANTDLHATVAEMINPHTAIYPNPNDRCGYCLFRNPCIARQRALPLHERALALATNYKQNDRYLAERNEE